MNFVEKGQQTPPRWAVAQILVDKYSFEIYNFGGGVRSS